MPDTPNHYRHGSHQATQTALDKLEAAQRLVEDAAETLCPLTGYADEWTALRQLRDTINAHWHQVDGRRTELQATEPAICPQCGGVICTPVNGHCSFICSMAASGDPAAKTTAAEDRGRIIAIEDAHSDNPEAP